MGRRDELLHWKTKRLWIPVNMFLGWNDNAAVSGGVSLSQGTTSLKKSGEFTTEIVSAQMAEADEIHTILPIPWDLDRSKKVLGRIYFVHESNAADTGIIWKWGTLFFAKGAAMSEIQGNADTTKTFAAHTATATLDSLEVTVWNDLQWDQKITSTDVLAGIAIEFDTNGDAENDECNLLGVEIMYQVNALEEVELASTDADLLSNPT